MAWRREMLSALGLGLRSHLTRPRHLLLVAAGFMVACAVLLIVLTIPAGLGQIAGHTGRDDIAVVLSASAADEASGNISPDLIRRLGTLPGVAHEADGTPLVAPQFVVHIRLKRDDGDEGSLLLRGVSPILWKVVGHSVHLSSGLVFKSGLDQLVAGSEAARQYVFAHPGAGFTQRFTQWTITGVLESGGSLWDAEIWGDIAAVQAAYNAQGTVTTAWVRLTSPAALAVFTQAVRGDPQLAGLQVIGQHDFYAGKVAFLATFVRAAAVVIAIILGLEAMLTINNAVGLSLTARRHELAILRATGYRQSALLAAIVAETLLIGAACTVLIIIAGSLLLSSHSVDSTSGNLAIHFSLAVTPKVVAWTFGYAMLLGLTSTLIPGWRGLHAPLAATLARD